MKRHFLFEAGGLTEGNGGGAPAGVPVKNQLIGQVSQEQIADWKKAYPLGVYKITVGGHVAYMRMPGFDEMNYGYSKGDQDAIVDMWRAFAEITKLGGSDLVFTNPTLFAGAMKIIQKKVDGTKAKVEDL